MATNEREPIASADKKPDFYGFGRYEDEGFKGKYGTFEEAALAAFDYYSDEEHLYVCEGFDVNVENYIHADGILDNIQENSYDEVADASEGWLEKVPNEKSQELKELIAKWVMENFPPRFWRAENIKAIKRSDYPDADQLPPLE